MRKSLEFQRKKNFSVDNMNEHNMMAMTNLPGFSRVRDVFRAKDLDKLVKYSEPQRERKKPNKKPF